MTAPTAPRHKRSARETAYQLLREQIITSALPPGAALSENELAAALGLSRTPVREALLLLARDDLVQVFPKVGSFVARVDADAVREAQFLREAVEVSSLQSIIYPLDEGLVAHITENLRQQDAQTDDPAAFFTLDEEFHASIMALAGHGRSWSAVAQAKSHLDRARMLGLKMVSSTAQLAAEHRAVFEHILTHDLAAAAESLRSHVRRVFPDIDSMRVSSPELFSSDSAPTRRSIAVWE